MSQFYDPTQVRTLHRLVLPSRCHDPGETPVRLGVYVDVETTGAHWARDAVVELALLPFTFADDGQVAEVLHEQAHAYGATPGVSYTAPPEPGTVAVRHIDARTRWRADPADCARTSKRTHRESGHGIA